jgi:hypothetical protein
MGQPYPTTLRTSMPSSSTSKPRTQPRRLWAPGVAFLAALAAAAGVALRRRGRRLPPVAATTPYGTPLPPVVHQVIDKPKPGRLIVVGESSRTAATLSGARERPKSSHTCAPPPQSAPGIQPSLNDPQRPVSPLTTCAGDVHGTPELFDLLDRIRYLPQKDNLILSGDLVNKGPCNGRVLDALPQLDCWAVRGNHDDATLAAYRKWRQGAAAQTR